MVNGQEYAWEDIQVGIGGLGEPLGGILGIEYGVKREHKNLGGRGADPHSMIRGNKEYEGTITLLQSEVERMQRAFGSKPLTDRPPFPITVAYAPETGDKTVDALVACRIGEVKKAYKREDMGMVVDLPLIIFRIDYNV